jgi:hypothetical protein
MTALVKGIYKKGKIDLLETPPGMREGNVRVLLVEEPAHAPEPQYLQPGKYGGRDDSTLEDFEKAEWQGEPEFDDLCA